MLILPEALERYSQGKTELSKDMKETAFKLAHSGGEVFGEYGTVWDLLEQDGKGDKKGWRQRNFNAWMGYLKDIFGTVDILLGALDWDATGDATVVDVSLPFASSLSSSIRNRMQVTTRRDRDGETC